MTTADKLNKLADTVERQHGRKLVAGLRELADKMNKEK